jgi:hypothetical protein
MLQEITKLTQKIKELKNVTWDSHQHETPHFLQVFVNFYDFWNMFMNHRNSNQKEKNDKSSKLQKINLINFLCGSLHFL